MTDPERNWQTRAASKAANEAIHDREARKAEYVFRVVLPIAVTFAVVALCLACAYRSGLFKVFTQ